MKPTLLLLTAVLAIAQDPGYFRGQPSCAVSCLTSTITASGCQLNDVTCQRGPIQSDIEGPDSDVFPSRLQPLKTRPGLERRISRLQEFQRWRVRDHVGRCANGDLKRPFPSRPY
ncbi:hypothetical protein F5X99DRAFT_404483 [Biscogniauxia marginata]|nr:hypothetical protein F5X99DRAFT_404483 [Biscogniauxia marginata]